MIHKPLSVIALLATLILSGTISAAPTDLALRTKVISVVVLAGQDVQLARVGVMVFGNKRAVVPAPDEALQTLIFDAVKLQIEQEGRAEVRRVALKPDEMRRMADKAYAGITFFGPSIRDLAVDLAPLRKECACDALLVVAESKGLTDPNSNQIFKGLSWIASSSLTGETVNRSAAAAFLLIYLVDAQTGEVVGTQTNAADTWGLPVPVPLPPENWPLEMTSISVEQWSTFLQAQSTGVNATLRRPLYRLGLKPSCALHFFRIENPVSRGNPRQNPTTPPSPPPLLEGADPAKCK